MKYGFVLPGGDFRTFGDLAYEAEAAGWDGIFIPDALGIETKSYPAFEWFDPWVVLAVMAMRTERIRIGTMLTALPRRRPWKLARETGTLDHLSGGRLILSVGLGAAQDDGGFYKVGEPMDLRVRAERLDEGLEILSGLWSGKPFSFTGNHYRVEGMTMLPPPVQSPRIPVWVVGVWPKEKSLRRVLSYDGVIPQKYKAGPSDPMMSPEEIRALKAYVDERRQQSGPFDIIVSGTTPKRGRKRALEQVRQFEEAGATWWMESVWSMGADKILDHIKQGPPRS